MRVYLCACIYAQSQSDGSNLEYIHNVNLFEALISLMYSMRVHFYLYILYMQQQKSMWWVNFHQDALLPGPQIPVSICVYILFDVCLMV